MNEFEKIFSKLRKRDDPRFLWINWMDWVIDANLIAVHDRKLDFHGHEQDYYKLYIAWIDIVNEHLNTTDDYYYDYLGEFFEEHLINTFNKKDDGQFFTPTDVALLMGKLTFNEKAPSGFVYDCACGSARLLLDAHRYNPSNIMIGWDYDVIASRMAVLNFYVHGIRGSILRVNTLTGEFFEAWRINNILGYGLKIPHIELVNQTDAYKFHGVIEDTPKRLYNSLVVNPPKQADSKQVSLEAFM